VAFPISYNELLCPTSVNVCATLILLELNGPPVPMNSERNYDPAGMPKTSSLLDNSGLMTTSRTRVTVPLAPLASLHNCRSTSFHPEESLRKGTSESFVSSVTLM